MIRLLVLLGVCGAMLTACSSSMTKKDRVVAHDPAVLSTKQVPAWIKNQKRRDVLFTDVRSLDAAIYDILKEALFRKARVHNSSANFALFKFTEKPYVLPNFFRANQDVHPWPRRVTMSFQYSRLDGSGSKKGSCTAYYLLQNMNLDEVVDNIGKVKRGEESLAFSLDFEIDDCSSSIRELKQMVMGQLRLTKGLSRHRGYHSSVTGADKLLGQDKVVLSGGARIILTMPREVSGTAWAQLNDLRYDHSRATWKLEHQLKKDYKLNDLLYPTK